MKYNSQSSYLSFLKKLNEAFVALIPNKCYYCKDSILQYLKITKYAIEKNKPKDLLPLIKNIQNALLKISKSLIEKNLFDNESLIFWKILKKDYLQQDS